jgi:hypothetical protein
LTQFRTENRSTLFLELLQLPKPAPPKGRAGFSLWTVAGFVWSEGSGDSLCPLKALSFRA